MYFLMAVFFNEQFQFWQQAKPVASPCYQAIDPSLVVINS